MSNIKQDLIARMVDPHPPPRPTSPDKAAVTPSSALAGTQPPDLHLKDLPLSTLYMLHYVSLDTGESKPLGVRIFPSPEDRFKDDSAIYNHGGQVLRVFFPSTQLEEDVMVCDISVCTQCNPSANAEDIGRNLPFVHFERDCRMEGWDVGMFQPRLDRRVYESGPLQRGGPVEVGFVGEGNVWIKVRASWCWAASCVGCRADPVTRG